MIKGLLSYAQLARCLTTRPAWSKHAEQLAADAPLRTAVVDMLLTRSLPALAAYAGGECRLQMVLMWATSISEPLRSPSLSATSHERLQHGSGVAAAASQAVVSLAQALPTQRPADVTPIAFASAWAAITLLAAWSTGAACELSLGSGSGGDGSGGSRGSDAAGGSSATGSQAGVGSRTGAAGSSDEAPASPWDRVPVAALPQLMQVLQSFADDSHGPAAHPRGAEGWCAAAAAQCKLMAMAVHSLRGLLQCAPPPHAYTSLLEAVAAGLRLQPLLVRLHAMFQQLPQLVEGQDHRAAAMELSYELLLTLQHVPFSGTAWPAAAGDSDVAVAAERELHSRVARLIHWLAAGGQLPFMSAPGLTGGLAIDLQRTLVHIFLHSEGQHRCVVAKPVLVWTSSVRWEQHELGTAGLLCSFEPSKQLSQALFVQKSSGLGFHRTACLVCQPRRGSTGGG